MSWLEGEKIEPMQESEEVERQEGVSDRGGGGRGGEERGFKMSRERVLDC